MESIKRRVRVTIEKELEIELTPAVFGSQTEAEYLTSFRHDLWDVSSIEDVVTYAASMAAHYGAGMEHDGIGLIGAPHSTYPRVPDVKFHEVSCETETEIISPDS
ncbi:hypothetical protein [Aeromonas enterica]